RFEGIGCTLHRGGPFVAAAADARSPRPGRSPQTTYRPCRSKAGDFGEPNPDEDGHCRESPALVPPAAWDGESGGRAAGGTDQAVYSPGAAVGADACGAAETLFAGAFLTDRFFAGIFLAGFFFAAATLTFERRDFTSPRAFLIL